MPVGILYFCQFDFIISHVTLCRFSNDEDGPTCDSTPLFVIDRVGSKKTTTELNGNVLSNNNEKIKSTKEQNVNISNQSSTVLKVGVSNMFLQFPGSNNSHVYSSVLMCNVLRTNQNTILTILYLNSGS